jgi:hypothetical protein
MRFKTVFLLLPAVLFVLVGEARADKSYEVKVTTAAKAGSVQLRPGDYDLVLDNSRILFRESVTGKEYPVEAKIDDSAEKKFEKTLIYSRQKEGATLITKIELGGTKTTVAFP